MPAMPVTTVQKIITVMIIVIMRMKRVAQRLHGDGARRAQVAEDDGGHNGETDLHP